MLPVRHIHEGVDVIPQAAPDIAHDADDRARLVIDEILGYDSGSQVCLEACAEGILPREELARHGLIDDGYARSAGGIARREHPTLAQRDLQRPKIVRADLHVRGLERLLASRCGTP